MNVRRILFDITEVGDTWRVESKLDDAVLCGTSWKKEPFGKRSIPSCSLSNKPVDQTLRSMGNHLFKCLFEKIDWKQILDSTKNSKEDLIEIALSWDNGQSELTILPWEQLRDDSGLLLAASDLPLISITRIVKVESVEDVCLRNSRVLCIVGDDLTDPELKVGSEYIGLLRRSESLSGHVMNIRLLLEASIPKIKAAIEDFQPSVLHFICHGRFSGEKPQIRLLNSDGTGPEYIDAETLVKSIGKSKGDTLIVLGACQSASQSEASTTEPFAMELVRGGFPIVIGMAGNVADSACRLFALRFYEVMLSGGCVLAATAEGRSAGFSDVNNCYEAFPSIFLAENVSPSLKIARESVESTAKLRAIARKFVFDETPPVVCGRQKVFSAFERILNKKEPEKVLGFRSERELAQFGLTRLISEFSVRSVFNEFIPILIKLRSDDLNPETIDSKELLVDKFIVAISDAAEKYLGTQLPVSAICSYREYLSEKDEQKKEKLFCGFDQELRNQITLSNRLTATNSEDAINRCLKSAIRSDLIALCAMVTEDLNVDHRAIILFDNAHQIQPNVLQLLLSFIGQYGMGNSNQIFPVIFSYAYKRSEFQAAYELLHRWFEHEPFARTYDLKKFDWMTDRSAYEQILLLNDPPLAAVPGKHLEAKVELFYRQLHKFTNEGIPSEFRIIKGRPANAGVSATLQAFLLNDILVEADDNALLKSLRAKHV